MTYDPRDPDGLIEAMVKDGRRVQQRQAKTTKVRYRAIPDYLAHDAAFQSLSPQAKLVWLFLRLLLGASGIDVLYPELLPHQTGMSEDEIDDAIDQLEQSGWLEIEGNIFWLVDALRDDPNLTLNNPNHVTFILEHLHNLPRQPMVNRFADHYRLDPPFPEADEGSHPGSHRNPIPDQEKGDRRYETGETRISGKKRTRAAQKTESSLRSRPRPPLLAATDLPATTCPSCDGPKAADGPLCETCEYARRNPVRAAGGRSRDGRHEPGDRS